jgi:DNA-binding transcriptional LysR family regulator
MPSQYRFDLAGLVSPPSARATASRVSLAQIQYFVAVAEQGHMRRAAEALRIAQPAISRQIRQLEAELGADLFVRTPYGMRLSTPGRLFLEHAQAILATLDNAREAVRDAADQEH